MADTQQNKVVTHEAGGPGARGAPVVAGPGIHPTSQTHQAAGGAHTPLGLERKSASEAVGPDATAKASTVTLTPASDPSLPPHISAPGTVPTEAAGSHGGGGVGHKLKEAWHGLKEITPGTKEHRQEFGTDTALGGYRSQMGKR